MGAAIAILVAGVVAEEPMVAMVRNTAYARVRKAQEIAGDPALVQATVAKNDQDETLDEILARDDDWRAGRGELRETLVTGPCAARLRELIADDPLVVEAILMDRRGALVCASAATSDYYQGDEAKWQQPVRERKAVFVDEPALDESTGTYGIQLSVPVGDAGGEPIGALTLTLQLSAPAAAEGGSPR